jgi:competence protein ComEC
VTGLWNRPAGWRWAGLLAVLVALIWLASRELPDGRLHVHFLDVGQGNAVFVQAPDGRQILIDGGPSPTVLLNQLAKVMPFWDRSLDLVVLTHADADHMIGLLPLMERYRVAQVLDVPEAAMSQWATPWLEALARPDVQHTHARRGMRLMVGQLVFTVLHPGAIPITGSGSDSNNSAIVLRLDYGQTSFLLASDAELPAEADMMVAGLPLRADVLQVAHHGSNASTSAPFLASVAPRIAIIQAGAGNRFGHPHPDLLGRLAGVEVRRTDEHGRIEVVSDGQRLWMETERSK